MVSREEFEKQIMAPIVAGVGEAQRLALQKYGFRFEVQIDWALTEGKFDDEAPAEPSGGFGG